MSSLQTEDYSDSPAAGCNPSEGEDCKPPWSSADAHLNPPNKDEVKFSATNSRFTQGDLRDKIPSKLLMAVELGYREAARVSPEQCKEIDSHGRQNGDPEHEVLDAWNPMSEDYKSQAFNSYKEPTVADFVKSFPGYSSQSSQLFTNSDSGSGEGEVRLYVGKIPPQMTKEGLNNLFSQVGKLLSCKLIPQHGKDTNIGFVGYNTLREAEAAIQKFDGLDLGQGIRLKVALALVKQKPAFTDLEEVVHVVNGNTTSPGMTNGPENATPVSRQNETSLEDGVSPSTNTSISYTGKPCNFCGQLGLKWCSVCKIPYCSRDCQKNDWPKHKLVCLQRPPAERKTANSVTSVPLTTTTPGDVVHSPEKNHNDPDFSHSPPGVSLHHSEESVASTAHRDSQEDTERSPENERDPVRVDGFDVNNVEMFAEMMGFDINQVKFVEKGEDVGDSDKSSSSSLDSSISQEVSSKSPVAASPEGRPSPKTVHMEHAERLGSGTTAREPDSQSVITLPEQGNPNSQQPSCAKGYKRFFIKQISMESVPTDGFFEAVVTEVENPSCVWVQLCTPEALERHDQLKTKLQALYSNSANEKFVPSAGEVCVAQFSFDSRWYRVKVDVVNNTGTLRVTYIDFGNHEDVTVEKVRRITEDLVSFPRQALKLSLHGIISTSPSGNWSSEATTFVKSKVLGIKCKVQVFGQHNEVLFVQLYDPEETRSYATINEGLIASGFAKTRGRPMSSQNIPQRHSGSQQWHGSQDSPQLNAEQKYSEQKEGIQGKQRRPLHHVNNLQGQVNQMKSPYQSGNQSLASKELSNPSRNFTGTAVTKEAFEAVINAIVNPWEFYVQKTDTQLVSKLSGLMADLNRHIKATSFLAQSQTFSSGQLCAAKFSLDNLWYRAVILEKLPNGVKVRYIDFGNSEVVQGDSIGPLPQHFQNFAPLSMRCSLAGVAKPKGKDWSPEAVQLFKSLVCNKPFLCRIVHKHEVTSIVELQDPGQNREQSVASALISAGLADAFIHKDGTKHQLVGKRGPSFTRPQQQVATGTPEPKAAVSDMKKPPFGAQSSGSESSVGPFTGDGVESAVFEPAIQAAGLPQDIQLDVVVTEVMSPGVIYLGSLESSRNTAKLTQDMNEHYGVVCYPPFVPHENDLCAALFTKTGDWCRAFIEGTSPNGTVYVHYVDYGNTEFVPQHHLRPLNEQFNFTALPFSALRCSIANVVPLDSSGWSEEAKGFVKTLIPEYSRCNARVVGRRKGRLVVDITINETGQSVSQTLVKQGLARVKRGEHDAQQNSRQGIVNDNVVKESRSQTSNSHVTATPPKGKSEKPDNSPLESVVFQPAIQSATLPQDESYFYVMLTEVTKTGLFFVQVADHETAQKLKNLSDDMNATYGSSGQSFFHPHTNQLCAALFAETGDWCRAIIKDVTPDGLVDVHYVDFGNTEKLPVSSIKPLADKFANATFFALPCYLANISQPEPHGWSEQAMALIKKKVPLFQRASAQVLGKRHGMLLIDFAISTNPPQSLSQLLLNEGLAQRSVRGDTHLEQQGGPLLLREPLYPLSQQSASSTSSSRKAGSIESCVFEPALKSVMGFDAFDAMLTDVSSPSSLFIQVLQHDKVEALQQLSADLNAHYSTVNYPPFGPQTNEMCAGLFSDTDDWCRGFIDGVNSDGSVHVHYLDYGNSEVLPCSRVRPLEERFQKQSPMALKCSLSGVLPAQSNGWSDNAKEAILSQAPLNSHLKVKVVGRESCLLFIDAFSPDFPSQESLSQFLITQGLASANLAVERPVQSSPATSASDNHFYASAIPLVDVPTAIRCRVLISEVQRPDKIFVQVLTKENVQGLLAMSETLNTRCCTVDTVPYKPALGELCCAKFSDDQTWYRAVVEQEISESQMMVVFVDYGNQAEVAVESIRQITHPFTQLPIQARECFLENIEPLSGCIWSNDAVTFLKERLMPQITEPFFAEFDCTAGSGRCLGVQLFEVSPNGLPGRSVSQDMIQRGLARGQDDASSSVLQMMVPNLDHFDVVITEVVHPGEIWGQVLDAKAQSALDMLMKDINQYCVEAPIPTSSFQPGQECCAQFSQDCLWYRARVLECPTSKQITVQFVDFGNSELLSPDKIRVMKDEFFKLPAQALKLSLANICPTHQVWSQDAVHWLKVILNRQLKATVVHRQLEHLVVLLEDWNVPNGPINISQELVSIGYAVKS